MFGFEGEDIGPYGFRLCFRLKDDLSIIGGTGANEAPYQLAKE